MFFTKTGRMKSLLQTLGPFTGFVSFVLSLANHFLHLIPVSPALENRALSFVFFTVVAAVLGTWWLHTNREPWALRVNRNWFSCFVLAVIDLFAYLALVDVNLGGRIYDYLHLALYAGFFMLVSIPLTVLGLQKTAPEGNKE